MCITTRGSASRKKRSVEHSLVASGTCDQKMPCMCIAQNTCSLRRWCSSLRTIDAVRCERAVSSHLRRPSSPERGKECMQSFNESGVDQSAARQGQCLGEHKKRKSTKGAPHDALDTVKTVKTVRRIIWYKRACISKQCDNRGFCSPTDLFKRMSTKMSS